MFSIRKLALSRAMMAGLAIAGTIALGLSTADARVGGNKDSGSRGSQTQAAPPATNTAPRAAQPIQRSTVQPSAVNPGRAGAAPSRFGSGFGGMLMGGLLGAGLFGLLSGSGLFGGAAGMAGMLGLLLQVALIGGVIWLAVSFFRRRQAAPATGPMANAMASPMERQSMMGQQPMQHASTPAGSFAGPAAAAPVNVQPLAIVQEDYEAFERLLVRIQDAYGKEDLASLRAVATHEMANYFGEDIAENQRKKQHNLVSDAKLLQGDLSESWREQDAEYATVSMRFSILDTMVERGTGRVLGGNSEVPTEATEFWTFVRRPGSNANGWKLSAIQQTV